MRPYDARVDVTSLGFATDLMVLRMGGTVVTDEGTHLVVRTPGNPGYWWGNFLLLDGPPRAGDGERWAKVFAAEFPDAHHLALGVNSTDGDPGDPAELTRLHLVSELSTVLTATGLVAPPAAMAQGVVVRALAGDDDWAQSVALRLACDADGPGAASAEHERFVARKQESCRALCEAGRGAWFGAFVDGRMRAGAGVFSDGGGLARYQTVETDPAYRRRGLASAVVRHAGEWALRELAAHTLVIVADPAYHAIHLYRALGFTDREQQVQLQRPPAAES